MSRNIANVVHDLRPIVSYLKKKVMNLPNAKDPQELMDLIEKIQGDALMLERYLEALEGDVRRDGVVKI